MGVRIENTFITVEEVPTLPVRRSSSAPPGFSSEFMLALQQKESHKLQQKEIHDAGLCKPCVYLEKAITCRWGDSCDFCHFCPPGEIRRRKKQKKTRIKTEKWQASESWKAMQSFFEDQGYVESGIVAGRLWCERRGHEKLCGSVLSSRGVAT
eukprot:TRINITY_DN15077_c0_g1_i1.p1 TRINITY_DN15077_c0_g1~~TRINITY_DN15077_c0_g1_i1.p1  ORF type:complete len:171 (+),score=31.06 TRINITY_DN15077_c0_g1_i1:55-513(+)